MRECFFPLSFEMNKFGAKRIDSADELGKKRPSLGSGAGRKSIIKMHWENMSDFGLCVYCEGEREGMGVWYRLMH